MHGVTSAARALLGLALLGLSAFGQDPTGAAAARVTLESLIPKGTKDITAVLDKRGNDVFDVLVTAVGTDPAPLANAKKVAELLAGPERDGVKQMLSAMEAAKPEEREAFARGVAGLGALESALIDPKGIVKAVAEAQSALKEKLGATPHPWLKARAAVADALAGITNDSASAEPALKEAVTAFAAVSDRYHLALASALWSKALLDANQGFDSIRARENAQALVAELKVQLDRPGLVTTVLARVDLVLARRMFDEGWDEPALTAAQRARSTFKTYDPTRDLDAAVVFAWLMIERRSFAAALEALKPYQAKMMAIERRELLLRYSNCLATALRLSGKPQVGADILKKVLVQTKQMNADPKDEVVPRFALALCLAQSNQTEAAAVAFEGVARQADDAGVPAIGRAAIMNRALLQLSQKRDVDGTKTMERAIALSAGGPTLDRIQGSSAMMAYAELLVDMEKLPEAMKWFKLASGVAEELGVSPDDLRSASGMVVAPTGVPMATRLASTITTAEVRLDWASLEPAFLAAERPGFDIIAKLASDDTATPEMIEQAQNSRRQITRILRGLAGLRPAISEDETARIVRERKGLMDGVWTANPAFATKAFPRIASIARTRTHYCGIDGAVFHAVITSGGSYVMGFSRHQMSLRALNTAQPATMDLVAAYRAVMKNPKSSIPEFLAAAGPLYDRIIEPVKNTFEGKKWIAVYVDKELDDVPIECLVPPGTTATSWKSMPFLMNSIAIARVPTASRALMPRERRTTNWLSTPWLGAVVTGAPDEVLAGARYFDPSLSATQLKGDRANILTLPDYKSLFVKSDPPPEGRFPNGGVLWFGPGYTQKFCDWPHGSTPEVVVSSDLLTPQYNGDDLPMRLLGKGPRAVVHPRAKMDKALALALVQATLQGMGQQGLSPAEAVTEAKKSLVQGTLKVAGAPPKDEMLHPASWCPMEAWVVQP